MNRAMNLRRAFGTVLTAVALVGCHVVEKDVDADGSPAAPGILSTGTATSAEATEAHLGFIYGRVTTDNGDTYEGRLRWGGDQEAFWGDYFNGSKDENPWVGHAPREWLPKEPSLKIFGLEFGDRKPAVDLRRPFMARFGDITRIEGRDLATVRVTLKSGTVVDLDRFGANDFDDGVRVWDSRRGIVDLESWAGGVPPPPHRRIRTIELLPTARLGAASDRLRGTVRTPQGEFTGFVQWDRKECVGSDELDGRSNDAAVSLRFDTIRSIARRSRSSSHVTLLDGREIVLSGTREVGEGNRGIYVDDPRYGRVLISWDAFERVDWSPGGSGPAYGDFPPGRPLTGTVTTRDGRRLAGRLVYDLDESETTETLDAPSQGVDYTIPFGLIASIVPPGPDERGAQRARVTLHSGEELQLERTGDLGDGNAGMLIFVDGGPRPEYVPWTDVEQVDLDRPQAMYPPLGGR
jgi:hypothetical protein